MLMKVHNKGQIVIPADVRKQLDIDIGDLLEVTIDNPNRSLVMKKNRRRKSAALAGSLSRQCREKAFPSTTDIRVAVARGFSGKTQC